MSTLSFDIPFWLLHLVADLCALAVAAFLLRGLLLRLLARRGRLYLAGRPRAGGSFDVLGIFSRRSLAEAACTRKADFYIPLPLDERQPDERVEPPEVIFPHRKKRTA